ncbi:hypothetical protein THAOC_16744, partial [Thalassiosira oceanica]
MHGHSPTTAKQQKLPQPAEKKKLTDVVRAVPLVKRPDLVPRVPPLLHPPLGTRAGVQVRPPPEPPVAVPPVVVPSREAVRHRPLARDELPPLPALHRVPRQQWKGVQPAGRARDRGPERPVEEVPVFVLGVQAECRLDILPGQDPEVAVVVPDVEGVGEEGRRPVPVAGHRPQEDLLGLIHKEPASDPAADEGECRRVGQIPPVQGPVVAVGPQQPRVLPGRDRVAFIAALGLQERASEPPEEAPGPAVPSPVEAGRPVDEPPGPRLALPDGPAGPLRQVREVGEDVEDEHAGEGREGRQEERPGPPPAGLGPPLGGSGRHGARLPPPPLMMMNLVRRVGTRAWTSPPGPPVVPGRG